MSTPSSSSSLLVFAMPVSGVVESAPVPPEALSGPGPRFEVPFRKGALPVFRVADNHDIETPGFDSLEFDLCHLVDEIVGAQDIVVKPMPKALSAVRCVAGAAELGGRTTVLVLDVPALVAEARAMSAGREIDV